MDEDNITRACECELDGNLEEALPSTGFPWGKTVSVYGE